MAETAAKVSGSLETTGAFFVFRRGSAVGPAVRLLRAAPVDNTGEFVGTGTSEAVRDLFGAGAVTGAVFGTVRLRLGSIARRTTRYITSGKAIPRAKGLTQNRYGRSLVLKPLVSEKLG